MTLVKIGQTIFNFDQVTSVRDLSSPGVTGPIVVEFGKGHSVQVHAHAGALQAWLNARLVTPADPTPP